jgi:hypothetical protein
VTEAAPIHDKPPDGYPPILLTIDYSKEGAPAGGNATIRDGRLRVASEGPQSFRGQGVGERPFRDVVLEAQVSLSEGGENDLYGIFVRQAAEVAYYCFAVTPSARVIVGQVAGGYNPVVDGNLAPDQLFNRGIGQPNRFQVVACGPCLTFVLNGMVVTGTVVDPRYKEGYVGFYLLQTEPGRAELASDWIQVRAIFPE